jgi:hypothetical protein
MKTYDPDRDWTKLVKAGPVRTKPGPIKRAGLVGKLSQDRVEKPGYEIVNQLQNLINDKQTPASAKVTAARTLAEIDGRIGRHQSAPSPNASAPLATLSRDQLIAELERLRTLFELGLIA